MRILETAGGRHGRIEVLEHGGALALSIDGVIQTLMPPSTSDISKGTLLRGGDHVELAPRFRPEAGKALIIGLGGGLHARALDLYGISVTAVEIDPEVVRIAREYFGITCETSIGDGRDFLERDPRHFDAIVLDAFAGTDLPEQLFTKEAFEAAGYLPSSSRGPAYSSTGKGGRWRGPASALLSWRPGDAWVAGSARASAIESGCSTIGFWASRP